MMLGGAWHGGAWRGVAGMAGRGEAWHGTVGQAWHGRDGSVRSRLGAAWQGRQGTSNEMGNTMAYATPRRHRTTYRPVRMSVWRGILKRWKK